MLTYISNTDHYKEVLSRVQSVKHMLWIGTADIKDLYVEVGKEKNRFLPSLLISYGVVWRYDSFMPKNLARTFGRTLINTQCYMTAWSECFVHVFISRCLCSTEKKYMSVAQTLQVLVSE